MDTAIMLIGTLLPILAASLFYVDNHLEARRARVPVRHDVERW